MSETKEGMAGPLQVIRTCRLRPAEIEEIMRRIGGSIASLTFPNSSNAVFRGS